MMKRETFNYIAEKQLLCPGDRVVVGVSGGADSVCLLHVLWCLKEELHIELRAVHIHHGIRGAEADRDAAFSMEFCAALGVCCETVRICAAEEARKQGVSLEEAGRIARYRIMEQIASGWTEPTGRTLIAVAHHGNDSAETILHNLFRGSGLKGLGGIAPLRGRIIRPLLWADRAEILSYLSEQGLFFVEDSTNGENDYTRNKLRNLILPLVTSEINEKAVQNILRAGEMMAAADRYFETKADEWLRRWDRGGTGSLPVQPLLQEEPLVRGYIVRLAIREAGGLLKDLSARHIEDVLSLSGRQTGKQVNLPGGLTALREYDSISIFFHNAAPIIIEGELPKLQERIFPCRDGAKIQREIPKNQYTKWFDYDKIKNVLSVRFRAVGDFYLLPEGKKKTVKAFMIDEKIPAALRGGIPLLAEGSHILWIIGYRISEYYKVTENTKNILEVRLDGGAGVERRG